MWKPDRVAKEPLYKQIAQYYESKIIIGELLPGIPLPPERKLAQFFNVNRSTIRTAYEVLHSLGYVESSQGSGTRVSENLWGTSQLKRPNWHNYVTGGAFLPTLPLVKRIREAGTESGIINLAKAELSQALLPAKELQSTLGQLRTLHSLSYPDPKGDQALREAVSVHLHHYYRIPANPEHILITSGVQQAFHLLTQCLLSPGDAIAMEAPSYTYSLPLFISAGLRLYPLPMDKDGLIPDEVIALHKKHKIKMVFTNPTFQNPTGTILSDTRRKRLLEICEELRIPIIEDDVYGALSFHERVLPLPLMAMNKNSGSVIYVGSLSKTVAPGLRIGWLVGPESVIERLADSKQQMDFGINVITQQLVYSYFSSNLWQTQIDRLRLALVRRQGKMIEALEKYGNKQIEWTVPDGGYHVWCRLKTPVREADLLEKGINEGVLFVPGSVYGADKGYIRLTHAWEDESKIEEGVVRLCNMLKTL